MENVNWLALVVAAIIPIPIGYLWYNVLFKKQWIEETGITDEKAQEMNPVKTFGLAIVFAFFIAFFLMVQVFTGGAPGEPHGQAPFLTFKHGALHGAMVGILVALPIFANNALFEQRSFRLTAINVSYWIVTMALMGGLINAWV